MSTTVVEEVDIVVDPRFVERERNRYASRAVGYLVILNGLAAIVLLAALTQATAETAADVARLGTAMLIFGAGAAAALGSAFFAYLNRTVALEWPEQFALRRVLRVLAVLAALGSAVCFVAGLNEVARAAPQAQTAAQDQAAASPGAEANL